MVIREEIKMERNSRESVRYSCYCRSIAIYILLASFQLRKNTAFAQVPQCTTDPICPSSQPTVVSTCAVNDTLGLSTVWRGDSNVFNCSDGHISLSPGFGGTSTCLPATARLVSRNDNSYATTLSVAPSLMMDGALIQCFYFSPDNLVQECVLSVVSNPPDPPGCVPLTDADIESIDDPTSTLVTLRWSAPLSEGPVMITGYSILISPPLSSYPSECRGTNPCNVSSDVTSLQFPFSLSTQYDISVSAMGCDGQLGEPRLFNTSVNGLNVPIGGIDRVMMSLEYKYKILKGILLSWNPLESAGGNITCDDSTVYGVNSISYQANLSNKNAMQKIFENVPCCNHTFTIIPLSSSDSEYNVTLRAVNDVGAGSETVFFINGTKYFFIVDYSLESKNTVVNFTCYSFDTGDAINDCAIMYGTDQENLTMSYTPDLGGNVTVYTEYFYKAVVTFDNSIEATVEGNFTTCGDPPIAPTGCAHNYTGFGTTVIYTCSEIFELVGSNIRTCNVTNKGWGEAPTSRVKPWIIIVIVAGALASPSAPSIIVVIIVVVKRKRALKNSQTHHKDDNSNFELKKDPKRGVSDSSAKSKKKTEQNEGQKKVQSPPQAKAPSQQQQQSHSSDLVYADLAITNKKPGGGAPSQGQHQQSMQASLAPEEVVEYAALQNQKTDP